MEEVPRDYVVESFEEKLNAAYQELSFVNKILFHMQDYIVLVTIVTFVLGYIAGMNFGKFW